MFNFEIYLNFKLKKAFNRYRFRYIYNIKPLFPAKVNTKQKILELNSKLKSIFKIYHTVSIIGSLVHI